jgi:hypothetical protein
MAPGYAAVPTPISAPWFEPSAADSWSSGLRSSSLATDWLSSFDTAATASVGGLVTGFDFWIQPPVEHIAQGSLPLLNPALLTWFDPDGLAAHEQDEALRDFVQAAWEAQARHLREYVVRLVVSRRAVLRKKLGRALRTLLRRSNGLNFSLALLAASCRFGHRGEPEHHGFPPSRQDQS